MKRVQLKGNLNQANGQTCEGMGTGPGKSENWGVQRPWGRRELSKFKHGRGENRVARKIYKETKGWATFKG